MHNIDIIYFLLIILKLRLLITLITEKKVRSESYLANLQNI